MASPSYNSRPPHAAVEDDEEEEHHHHVASTYAEKERIRLHLPPLPKEPPFDVDDDSSEFLEKMAFDEALMKQQQRDFETRRIQNFDALLRYKSSKKQQQQHQQHHQ